MNSKLLTKAIDDKTIVWFEAANKYVVLENRAALILQDIANDISVEKIAIEQSKQLNIPYENVIELIRDLKQNLFDPNTKEKDVLKTNKENISVPNNFEFIKYYQINNITFKAAFQNEANLSFVHPKFAHLEVEKSLEVDFNYYVFTEESSTYFLVDNKIIGSWNNENIHYFQGKFSMQIVQDIHRKSEDKWMGVFHASAVNDNKNAILFLGDSGSGKSTSLALLQANGFNCLADDFVPIDTNKKEVYSFPSAISIKKNSLETLLPLYPELEHSAEYHFKSLNKIVRYLTPNNSDYSNHLPCKALVFIKYKKDSDLIISTISKIEAFEKLVPDSWISPIEENAQSFLDWFSNLPTYQLIYSDNNKMIEAVSKIFNDEL
ncbi:MAG: hypothetical protein COA67_12590 [Lutibacter sp.]|nr:MAG: hypothetical protein COA67_12590 [Lutibacter sp.]